MTLRLEPRLHPTDEEHLRRRIEAVGQFGPHPLQVVGRVGVRRVEPQGTLIAEHGLGIVGKAALAVTHIIIKESQEVGIGCHGRLLHTLAVEGMGLLVAMGTVVNARLLHHAVAGKRGRASSQA